MAVDTRVKRHSARLTLLPFLDHTEPTGTIDQDNRQTINHFYSAILAISYQGLMSGIYTATKPSILFSVTVPSISFTSKKPSVTITGEMD